MTAEPLEWIPTVVLVGGMIATFVRVEQRGASNRDELQDMRADVRRQHEGLDKSMTDIRNELRADIGILFKTSNEQEKRIERLLSINEQHERRIARAEDHIDKIGGEMGIGRPANGVVR